MNRKTMIGIICFLIVACLAVGVGLNNKGSDAEEKTVSISNTETEAATAEESLSSITENKTENVSVSEKNSGAEKSTEKASSTSNKAETKATEISTKKETKPAVTKKQTQQNSTTKKQTATDKTTKTQNIGVSFSINCEKAAEYGADYPNYLIGKTKCDVKDGTTVFDLLSAECSKNGIAVVHQNKSYVKAIGGLAEKDCGNGSGWTYKVNGVKPMMAASKYVLKNGDVVEWYYVTSPTD